MSGFPSEFNRCSKLSRTCHSLVKVRGEEGLVTSTTMPNEPSRLSLAVRVYVFREILG